MKFIIFFILWSIAWSAVFQGKIKNPIFWFVAGLILGGITSTIIHDLV